MTLQDAHLIRPDWPVPSTVQALQTTRLGGFSQGPYASLNLGMHVGDDPVVVAANRNQLAAFLPSEPLWLEQVHGTHVVEAETAGCQMVADACVARTRGAVCAVMTADCLPVLLCDTTGSVVGAAHAGWRGLAGGVIEATVAAMACAPDQLMAWLGPAIGPQAFEVGAEVREAFADQNAQAASAFVATVPGKYRADIYQLARLRLQRLGIRRIYGGDCCTFNDPQRFFSYRRDSRTGRMASLIWLA